MVQNISAFFFFCLLVAVLQAAVDAKLSARLRGKHFDALEEFVRSPQIDAAIHGKTLKDLGIEQSLNPKDDQTRRRTQANDDSTFTLNYFTVSMISNNEYWSSNGISCRCRLAKIIAQKHNFLMILPNAIHVKKCISNFSLGLRRIRYLQLYDPWRD